MILYEPSKSKVKYIPKRSLLFPFQVLGSEKITVMSRILLLINDHFFSNSEVLT